MLLKLKGCSFDTMEELQHELQMVLDTLGEKDFDKVCKIELASCCARTEVVVKKESGMLFLSSS